jgi:D-alanyl-D-alanine carboxypeptidase
MGNHGDSRDDDATGPSACEVAACKETAREETAHAEVVDGVNGDMLARLNSTARQALRAQDAPGCTVALTLDRQLVLAAGFGSANHASRRALPAEAQTYAYSVTKPLMAVAALQLVEHGQLTLDTPLQSILPVLHDQPDGASVTLRHLLGHTGGLPDYGQLPAYVQAVRATPTQPWTADEFFEQTLRQQGLLFPPGQGWAYSNIGYLLVKQLLERLDGEPLRGVLQQRLFAPLGLTRSFVAETLEDATALTPGYSAFFHPKGGELDDITPRYHPGWVAHGVVIASAAELAQLFDALFAGELLSPELVAQMCIPTPVPHTHFWIQQPSYGLGLMLDASSRFGISAGHGGGGPGYDIGVLHCEAVQGHAVTSVALVNQDRPEAGMRIAAALIDVLATIPLPRANLLS